MDQLVGFLLHPPLCEIAKKLAKILKYPHFQSAFGTAVYVVVVCFSFKVFIIIIAQLQI